MIINGIKIEPGAKFRYYYGPGNRNNCIMHVRAYFPEDRIVILKRWVRSWKRWSYRCEYDYCLEAQKDIIMKY